MIADQEQYRELLERARKRYALAVDAEADVRLEATKDLDYISGSQWDEKIKREREQGPAPRPCLVFNELLPPVTQLGNQARQNKPAIQVSPVDSDGDLDTGKVIAGIARHIEYDSDADQAYDTALFYAAAGSFGYWYYDCEESDPLSFDQDIKTITVDDPFSIYLDCFARKPDRSDMKWAFIIDRMSNDAHEQRFGKDRADLSSDFTRELVTEGWRDEDSRRVARYYEVETVKKTLRMRKDPDGTVHPVYLEDLDKAGKVALDNAAEGEAAWVLDDETGQPRESQKDIPTVMVYIINGAEVLEKPVKWDGDTIPIVMVTGLQMTVRGKRKIFSMTRFARDPQQLLNFYKTMEAETIALAPKPKFIAAVGQIKSKRRDWQRANIDNAAVLEYDPVAVGDKIAPRPEYVTFDPPVQALSIGAAAAYDSIKNSTGYADPQLGKNRGDQSGVAIGKLQAKGDTANFHFMDNLRRALKRGGRIVVQLIPYKYDTAREVRIIGDDKKQQIVKVNVPFVDANGKPQHYKLDQGKYDVTVDQGASHDTQRQETREMMMALAQADPDIMKLYADIFFENSDFVGADRMAKRAKQMLPPQAQDQDDSADIPPQVHAQMQQLTTQLQQLQSANQQLLQIAKGKMAELQTRAESAEKIAVLNAESRERVANEGNRARILAAETLAKNATMNALAERDHDAMTAELDRRAELLHDQMSVESDASQDAMQHQNDQRTIAQQGQQDQQQQAAEQQHEQQLQQQEQQHAAGLQDSAQAHQADQQTSQQDAAAQAAQLQAQQAVQQQQAAARIAAKTPKKA